MTVLLSVLLVNSPFSWFTQLHASDSHVHLWSQTLHLTPEAQIQLFTPDPQMLDRCLQLDWSGLLILLPTLLFQSHVIKVIGNSTLPIIQVKNLGLILEPNLSHRVAQSFSKSFWLHFQNTRRMQPCLIALVTICSPCSWSPILRSCP